MMERTLKTLALAALLASFALTAQAACFADYKAKRNDPLQLHYGVIELPDTACGSDEAAAAQIADRISVDGWILLNVLSRFGAEGLEQRKESAGDYHLRY